MGGAGSDDGTFPSRRGILLVGHGTRDAEGLSEFFETVTAVARTLPEAIVEPCFLELAEPTIPQAVSRLAEQQVQKFVVMPLLLFAAGHAKRDIPAAVADALRAYPQVSSVEAKTLGHHPAIIEQSVFRLQDALRKAPEAPAASTSVAFVGRGSLDEDATTAMHVFAERVAAKSALNSYDVCFYAMALPTLQETLSEVGTKCPSHVVVLPHLLFSGQILHSIAQIVREQAAAFPHVRWLIADRLGPSDRLTEAIVNRVESAWQSDAKCLSAMDG